MSARLAVSAETGDLGEVESKLVLQPVDSVTGTTSEHANQVITSEVASL